MPNTFALVMLYCWPLVVIVLFRTMSVPKALCWAIVAGYLLLPTRGGFNIPMLPAINKGSIPTLSAALMCLLLAYRDRLEEAVRRPATGMGGSGLVARLKSLPKEGGTRPIFYALLLMSFVAPIFTVLTNREPLVYGPRVVTGLSLYDLGSSVQGAIVTLLPFMLAMRFLATSERHVILLRTLVLAALGYSLLVAYEARMSPQLSSMVYGFFPHGWSQHIRFGGFRPVVFLNHGLWLAIFMACATLAALALYRHALRAGLAAAPWLLAGLWLTMILIFTRSMGAVLLFLLFAPIVLFVPPRVQILCAAIVAGMVLTYPMLRTAGLVPTEALVSAAARVDHDRSRSLAFRFRHEDALIEKAMQKPLAGWGGWGRNRVFDEVTGRDLSTTDGAWVIIMGNNGLMGYFARFGLLTIPIIMLAFRRRDHIAPATAGLALVATMGLVDLIPNGTLVPVTWLLAGALAGRLLRQEQIVSEARHGETTEAAAAPALRHVRQGRGALVAQGPATETRAAPAGAPPDRGDWTGHRRRPRSW